MTNIIMPRLAAPSSARGRLASGPPFHKRNVCTSRIANTNDNNTTNTNDNNRNRARKQTALGCRGFCLHFSTCACQPCAGAMLIFPASFQY